MKNLARLISPTSRRIVTLNLNNPRDKATADQLNKVGWFYYFGPGTADARGWYQGDDPAIGEPQPIHRKA